jgi:Family of unknown function (DUF5329)
VVAAGTRAVRLRVFGLAVLGLSLSLVRAPVVLGQPPASAVDEVNYLLTSLGASGCEFYRNGSWYDAQAAAAHLRYKYARLVAHDRITTTEDFIDQAATTSSMSGKAYAVRCGQSPAISSNIWLYGLLSRHRATRKSGAPHAGRGAPARSTLDLNQSISRPSGP